MNKFRNKPTGFRNKPTGILTAVLVAQAVGFYSLSHAESTILVQPLGALPVHFGSWQMAWEGVVEKEVQAVLKADDIFNRTYTDGAKTANLFIAFFRSQRTGQAPHSPKNCLPGSGWVPMLDTRLAITMPGESQPRELNRYVVQKGDSKSVVVYWYQSRDRVIASEYWAKFYVVTDALRYNRTDTSLVRVVVPVSGNDVEDATQAAIEFIQSFFPTVRQHLPA